MTRFGGSIFFLAGDFYKIRLRWDYENAWNSTRFTIKCQIRVYNIYMSRHFYKISYPQQAKQESIDLHNAFVAFTHAIGLSKFFSFTPDLIDRDHFTNRTEKAAGDQTNPDTKPL